MAVRFPALEQRTRIATELGRIYPPENWLVIPRDTRAENITGETPFLKGKLGDPDKTNAQLAKEWTEKLGATVSSRQISKWRNRRIPEPQPDTAMPTSGYRAPRR